MKAKMAGRTRKALCLLCALSGAVMLCAAALAAQAAPDFRLQIDSLNLAKGVGCGVVVSIKDAQGAQVVGFEGLETFDVFSQGTSTSTSIANNVATYQADAYYTIIPKETGEFALKAYVAYDGQTYETNVLQISVVESADELGIIPDLFVDTALSHTEAYLGEKIVLSYVLYSRADVESLGFTDYITIDGVMIKEPSDFQITGEAVYVDGTLYNKYVIKQLIIDPLKTGVCTIPSFALQVNVLSETSGFGGFGSLMMNATTVQYAYTEEAELLIKPLPAEGKPDDFSGIVGELSLTGNYSRTELNYGDSLALQVEISGTCNLDGITNVLSGALPGFAVFENQKAAEETIVDIAYYAKKTFEAVLIPEQNGAIDVPPILITYFNPTTERYEAAEIPQTTITVLGEMPAMAVDAGGQSLGSARETVLINQLSYGNAEEGEIVFRLRQDIVIAIGAALAAILALIAIARLLMASIKRRNTPLKSMYRQLMGARDSNEVYSRFNELIKHCFGVSVKACTQSDIACSLPNDDLAARVIAIVEYMESDKAHDKAGCECMKKKIKDLQPHLRALQRG